MKNRQYVWQMARYIQGKFLVMLLAAIVGFTVFNAGLALVTREFFNALTGDAILGAGPYLMVALLVGVIVGHVAFRVAEFLVYIVSEFYVAALLRKNLFDYVLTRPGKSALPASAGEAVSRFRGDVDAFAGFVTWLPFRASIALSLPLGLFIMLRIDPLVTVGVFVPMAIVLATANLAKRRLEKYKKASREATGNVTGFIGELFGIVEPVKVANAEERMLGRFGQLNDARQRLSVRDSMFNALLGSVFRNTTTLGSAFILIIVGQAMRSGTFTVGDFALFVFYLGKIGWWSNEVGSFVTKYRQICEWRRDNVPAGRLKS